MSRAGLQDSQIGSLNGPALFNLKHYERNQNRH